tara:strand:- start:120 stop:380 length:261 start_codon:yes stop_codon:yes gene_type:complete
MSAENSHLTIRDDLVADDLAVPVHFLDIKVNEWLEDSDTLDIECLFGTNGEELNSDGYNTIVEVTEPKLGWNKRLGYVHSIDFDWN